MSYTCFEPEGSSSGRRLYVQLWYSVLYMHQYKQLCRWKLILMHVKQAMPYLYGQPSSLRWTLGVQTCRRQLTYLLTPWFRVLLEELTCLQLVTKFPAFYGTRMFITALTSVRHLSLSSASPIQSTNPHPTSWRSIL